MILYTIGFAGKNAETFFGLLMQNKIRTLVDIRLNNRSQLAGITKAADLPWFLTTIGQINYTYQPELAPDTDLLKDYHRKTLDWQDYTVRFASLLKTRHTDKLLRKLWFELDKPICLLCSEAEADHCHRKLVAEHISKLIRKIQIVNL